MPGSLLRRPATAPYFYRLFLIFQISDTALTYLFFSKKICFMQKSLNVLIICAQLLGVWGHLKCTEEKYHDFLKWIGSY